MLAPSDSPVVIATEACQQIDYPLPQGLLDRVPKAEPAQE